MLFITFNTLNQLVVVDGSLPCPNNEPPRLSVVRSYSREVQIKKLGFHRLNTKSTRTGFRVTGLKEQPWNLVIVITKLLSVDFATLAKNTNGDWELYPVLTQVLPDDSHLSDRLGILEDTFYTTSNSGCLTIWHLPAIIPGDPHEYWNVRKLRLSEDRSMFGVLQHKFGREDITSLCVWRDPSAPLEKMMPVLHVFVGFEGRVEVWKGIDIKAGFFKRIAVLELEAGIVPSQIQATVEQARDEDGSRSREEDTFVVVVGSQNGFLCIFRVQASSLCSEPSSPFKPSSVTGCTAAGEYDPVTCLVLKTVREPVHHIKAGTIARIYVLLKNGDLVLVVFHCYNPKDRQVRSLRSNVGDIHYDSSVDLLIGVDRMTGEVFAFDADCGCSVLWPAPGEQKITTKGLAIIDLGSTQYHPAYNTGSQLTSKFTSAPQTGIVDQDWAIRKVAGDLWNFISEEQAKEKELEEEQHRAAPQKQQDVALILSNVGPEKQPQTGNATSAQNSSSSTKFGVLRPSSTPASYSWSKLTDEDRRRFYDGGPLVGNENIPIGYNPCNDDGSLPEGWEERLPVRRVR
ncbi:hypothetical protein BJ508DRAFT_348538 [Ascobolus immersus RN42]|uniref:Uncharacterized protein n=1 Tax=Ascobolus immersus RN42 TaxID=1160509 RepID=A0A3N4I318_ASCIM|nr:hypothetical protein BJ508DRAFT_348538 [Ascobolus immersus RN42]